MDAWVQRSVCSPATWHASLSGEVARGTCDDSTYPIMQRFTAVPGAIAQPPLNAHVVALHLGGPKRVHRSQGKRSWVQDVSLGSMTLMPAYQANRWHTVGPIDFAHLVLSVGVLEQLVVEEFDREPATHQLYDTVGFEDPLLEQLFLTLLAQAGRSVPGRLYVDGLLTVFSVSLLEHHSTLAGRRLGGSFSGAQARGGLAGWQLRRVTDYMQAHLHDSIGLGGLAVLTGLSRAHFFRAFKQSTGMSPGQFLAEKRMRHAQVLLETSSLHIEEIATALGFCHVRHFATAFTKRVGMSPRLFRASRQ